MINQQEEKSIAIKFHNNINDNSEKKYNVTQQEDISRSTTLSASVSTSDDQRSTRSALKSFLMRKHNLIRRNSSSASINTPTIEGPPYHTMKMDTVCQLMKSHLQDGLSEQSIEEKRTQYGYNEMEGDGGVNPFKLMMKQFFNVMVLILVIAMAVSFAFKDWVEAGVIAFIMLLNAVIGFIQEYKAEKTMESLRQMASPTTQVIRDGQQKTVATRELVPGDIIVLKNGDVVGADCRVINSFNMDIDEALLTGESLPVNKINDVLDSTDVPLGDRINMTYSSTTVCKGRGKAIVVATGMQTEIGKIAKHLLDSDGASRTPLQKSLDRMALVLLAIAILALIIVFSVAKFQIDDQVVLYAISTAIAVIPEGLIAVVTLTQAFGVNAMAKSHALVRRLVALENLGACSHVCSDKTGTLTQAKMVLTRFWTPHSGSFIVSGTGFIPEGEIRSEEHDTWVVTKDNLGGLQELVRCAALCNMSEVIQNHETQEWIGRGDPTELGLQVFAHKLDMGKHHLIDDAGWKLISEYPFDSSIKRMSVLCQDEHGNNLVSYLKGATEHVLECCTRIQLSNDDKEPQDINKHDLHALVLPQVESLAKGGLRVLSLAAKHVVTDETKKQEQVNNNSFTREEIECDMVFLGLVGIYDAPRKESKVAVEKCHTAGITVHMLTGDHIATATAIAHEVSILPQEKDESESDGSLIMSAQEFDKLSDNAVDALAELPLVIARCSPDTKVKMVEALHRRHKICGMTGDGVNDSPSLKEADIGIAMGQGGSDVAKQASDIILVDDNFATIVAAIEEGRRVFCNICKFTVHMVSVNVAELTPLILCLAFRGQEIVYPLSPIQILFNNLITSAPPAMSLGLEHVSPEQMMVPPRTDKEGLFCRRNIIDILYYGVMMGLICLANYVVVIYGYGTGSLGIHCNMSFGSNPESDTCVDVFRARGALFVTMTVLLLLHAHTCRDLVNPTWTWKGLTQKQNYYMYTSWLIGFGLMLIVLYVPVINTEVFKHLPITWEWGMVAASVVVYILFAESWKLFKHKCFLK